MTAAKYKSERQRRGSQEKVAALLGVSRQSIARRETGTQVITREAELALCSLPLPRKKRGPEKGHNPSAISFYAARYYDKSGAMVMGFKRGAGFKGVLKAKNRLVQFFNNELKLITNDVFRLDDDFDIVVKKDRIYITHYLAFELLAEIQKVVSEKAASHLADVEGRVKFVSLDPLKGYVKDHPTAARLVAALRSRDDLEDLDDKKVKAYCRKNQILFSESDGKITPRDGHEIAFLQVLDRRRYTVTLIPGVDERYIANSRTSVPATATLAP